MIRVKLTAAQVAALAGAHLLCDIDREGPEIPLLVDHVEDFLHTFTMATKKEKKYYWVRFTSAQCRAFMMIWVDQQLPHFAADIIQELLAEFDKLHKSAQITAA